MTVFELMDEVVEIDDLSELRLFTEHLLSVKSSIFSKDVAH